MILKLRVLVIVLKVLSLESKPAMYYDIAYRYYYFRFNYLGDFSRVTVG